MAWPKSVRKGDLRIEYYRGSGPGGQKKNKTSSACRLTHLPTGIQAQAQESRHQHENREMAFRRLAAILVPIMLQQAREDGSGGAITPELVRSYRKTDNRVRDRRLGGDFDYSGVLDGDGLDRIIRRLLLREQLDPAPGA